VNNVNCLIVSNTIDYSTDLVCYKLEQTSVPYLRINRDRFDKYKISYDLSKGEMTVCIGSINYVIDNDTLKGVYFRAPVFLRENGKKTFSLEEQLYRSQWSSFVRNLIVFNKAFWVNNPVNIYRAENKMFQLQCAIKHGFFIPDSFVSNHSNNDWMSEKKQYVVKSLDTALFYDVSNGKEMFTYSNVITGENLRKYDLSAAPVFIQQFINPKIDVRVTYINKKMFAVKILHNGLGLFDDWRKQKDELEYIPFDLPEEIQNKTCNMMDDLGLNFGGIDFAVSGDDYYFIEVNPTGEWGWLEINTKMDISGEIANALVGVTDI